MASTRDVQDIMGMGGGPVQKPTNKKKKRIIESQPRLTGISREVQALMGDSVPPVQIVETPKYKSRPSLAAKLYKPRHWEERTFVPGTRKDGLVLRHWKRALPQQRPMPQSSDVVMEEADKPDEDQATRSEYQFEDEFAIEKWDISIRVPQYTDEQYEQYYKTDDWTREETDYLMRLVSDFDLRWILIADRYDPREVQPTNTDSGTTEGSEIVKQYSPRTSEQLKLRFYQIAAQDLEMRTPKSTMNPSEFALFEKMRNFDAKTEALRKSTAEKLFERTRDEAEEERTLLEELHRITKNEEDFINMRRDLYARLEAAPSLRRNERGEEQNIVLSSAGLSDLLSRLFAKEKLLKRRLPAPAENPSQVQQGAPEGRGRSNTQLSRRDTLETPTDTKKAGIAQPVPKSLTKAEEEKYGVSHPAEKLTSGVSFRHEKINRVTTAKSQVQTQKINAALTELEIPSRLSMPTERVCKEFERLVGQIQLLLDARKTLTRVAEEVKTLEEMRRQRLGEPNPETGKAPGDGSQVIPAPSASGAAEGQVNDTIVLQNGVGTSHTQTSQNEDGEPGPAIDEDDDDAEGDDDLEATKLERTEVDDDDEDEDEADQDNTRLNEDSMAQPDEEEEDGDDDDNEDGEEDEEENEEDEESEEDEDDDEGMNALRVSMRERVADNNQDDEEEEEEEEEDDDDDRPEPIVEADDEDEEADDEEDGETQANKQDITMGDIESEGEDPDSKHEASEKIRPTSAGSRGQKRGASVMSDASGAGSTRSGAGRKRKR